MAIVQNNVLLQNFHGKLGKYIVLRVVHGKTIASIYPDMSRVKRSPNQKAYNNLFREAVESAQAALKDPETKAAVLQRIKKDPKLKNLTPNNVLVSEFLKEQAYLRSREEATELVNQYREKFQLSDRQLAALKYLLVYGKMSNALYMQVATVSRATAKRDLADLVQQGILSPLGKGPVTTYVLLNNLAHSKENSAQIEE